MVFRAFSFSSTTDDGESLISKLNIFTSSISDIEIRIEATDHYWLSIYSFLVKKGFIIHVVNHSQTDGCVKVLKS